MSDQPKPPNMALIHMVQQARLAHDREAQPSDHGMIYWIELKCPLPTPAPTPRSGEFRLYTTRDAVDALWAVVKTATLAGDLGYKAKVSTSPTPDHAVSDGRTICIRTYDADDPADLTRISDTLASLGLSPTIYLRDKA